MRRLALAALFALALGGTAEAHKLKVFAAVTDGNVGGYAFFIGGGRAQGASWVAKDAAGTVIAAGTTDTEGRFSFRPPARPASDITVTVDTHEAHIASATLEAARFGAVAAAPSSPPPDAAPASAPAAPLSGADTAALVEAAVQRQVEPLLERIEAMDSRLRMVDILSGLFFIFGLAGMGLWLRARRS
ncbi:cobalamin biosynthesis protein CbiL [Ancylobacter terrae]|uniref:cobalamin biosynthesis protein CbiL n=1 Tax=Ancylobacter sp. sgz301288 TaxID=3342077 RepID=UPI00385899F6